MPQIITTKIAGVFKYPEAKYPLKALKAGDVIRLEREPTNAYDPNAIAIMVPALPVATDSAADVTIEPRFIKTVYVPKEYAAQLKNHADLKATKGEGWDAILIEVA